MKKSDAIREERDYVARRIFTGERPFSGPSEKFRENYDDIFRKKKKPVDGGAKR